MASVLIRGTYENNNRADRVAVSIGTCAAMFYNRKVLILPLTTSLNPLKVLVGERNKKNAIRSRGYTFNDTGMDALMRRVELGPVTAEGFSDCCTAIAKDRNTYDIAHISSRVDFSEHIITQEAQLTKLLKAANECYDLVLVITDACHNDVLRMCQRICDDEVTVISQGYKTESDSTKDSIYVINNYDASSVFTYKEMKKLYGISSNKKMYPFPYNIGFKDKCREFNAIEFLTYSYAEDKYDENYNFMEMIKRLTSAVMNIEKDEIEEPKLKSKQRTGRR